MIIKLSTKERDLILEQAKPSRELIQQLRFGVVDGSILSFDLAPMIVEDILGCTDEQVRIGKNRKLRRTFKRLYLKVFSAAQKQSIGELSDFGSDYNGFSSDPIQAAQDLLESREFESTDDMNLAIRQLYESHNSSPREEFRGLSPDKVTALLYSDWDSSDAGLQCNDKLSFDEVDTAEILHNARVFLEALEGDNGTKATSLGNLNRRFVLSMVESMRWPDGYVDDLWRYNKVLNEEDVVDLNILKVVCDLAGLIRKYKGRFVITRTGQSLVSEGSAGELYARLFQTYLRKFNLGYTDRYEEHGGIQETFAFSLYILDKEANGWTGIDELSKKVFLPSVSEAFDTSQNSDIAEALFHVRIIRPLVRFGLIECKDESGRVYPPITHIRKTPLYDSFLSFDLPD